MFSRSVLAATLALGLAAPIAMVSTSALAVEAAVMQPTEIRSAYHVNDSAVATAAMRNAKNQLEALPNSHIVVVTHSKGVDFLLKGAEDAKGNAYEPMVQELKAKGVEFRVCNNTLKSRDIDPSTVLPEAQIVPSGVAEIAKLQAIEHYTYVKP